MRRALVAVASVLFSCILGSGCSAPSGRTAALSICAPPGIVGLAHADIGLTETGFRTHGLLLGVGTFIAPDLLLVTEHQNPVAAGLLPEASVQSPGLLPILASLGAYPRSTAWRSVSMVGVGRISVRQELTVERRLQAVGRYSGELDFGWTVLRVDPPWTEARVRFDFGRTLVPNQTVYVLRPTAFGNPSLLSAATHEPSASQEPAGLIAILRAGLDRFTSSPSDFQAWSGRVAVTPRGPLSQFTYPDAWDEDIAWAYFEFRDDLAGASGSPVLIREGNDWVAIGIFSSCIQPQRGPLAEYQYGMIVRPRLDARVTARIELAHLGDSLETVRTGCETDRALPANP